MSLGIAEFALDLGRPGNLVSQPPAETQDFFSAYFWRKRSTRPAVSTNFCLPVKNGWQFEQISRCNSPAVERVCQVLPQAHRTVAVAYSGWMPAFTDASWREFEQLEKLIHQCAKTQGDNDLDRRISGPAKHSAGSCRANEQNAGCKPLESPRPALAYCEH
jgi:hypothetical protein